MKQESRFGHSEGTTDVGLTSDGKKILTCGSDGDIRLWDGFSDPDPAAFSASDTCFSLLCFQETVFVATESHTVEAFQLPDGKKVGVKAKFSAAVHHLDISVNGKILVAGSADATIQIINLQSDLSGPVKIEAHKAPVLSVAIDPLSKYFASSGCDGTVNVWSLPPSSNPVLIKGWENVFSQSNDISLSSTLCRMHWSPIGGKFLAIPEGSNITLYSRDTWARSSSFQCKGLTKPISVVRYSTCGKFIAAGCSNGMVAMWNTGTSEVLMTHSFASDAVTGLLITKTPTPEMYVADAKGRFHWISGISNPDSEGRKDSVSKPDSLVNDESDDVFDDGMDDYLFGIPEGDNENEFSISKIKADVGFIDDEYVGVDRATKRSNNNDEDDRTSVVSADGNESIHSVRRTPHVHAVNPFSEPQEPFQPTSTPKHLEHRFMVWNTVGIIRSYGTDDDDAIDIEFHDSSHHNAIHLRNLFDYSMATLSLEAIVFACEEGKDHPSKLFCLHYASWDSSKEWTCDMPLGEEVLAIAVGSDWIVAATNLNRLRLYSLGGAQHFIYDFPGKVVSVSGFNNLLFLTYHYGIGVQGSQSIFFSILLVKKNTLRPVILHSPMPLSSKSALSWIGFTEEGTPAFSDSSDTLRILNGQMWTPFCDMREFLSGPNDHFWVLGLSQLMQNIRVVKCKGAKYPPTLPRPMEITLDAKIPLCELETEKSQLEETVLRSLMAQAISKKMDNRGFDTEEFRTKARLDFAGSVTKLFELSVKGNRDFRGSEYVSLLPSANAIQVAVKHASRMRKNALVERLRALAQQKMESVESEEEDDDFESPRIPTVPENSFSRYSMAHSKPSPSFHDSRNDMNGTAIEASIERQKSLPQLEFNPLLQKQKEEIRKILCPELRKVNPFKKSEDELRKGDSQPQVAGSQRPFINAWKKLSDKPAELEFNPKYPRTKEKEIKTKRGEKDSGNMAAKKRTSVTNDKKKQVTLFEMRGAKTSDSALNPNSPTVVSNEDSSSNMADQESMDGEQLLDEARKEVSQGEFRPTKRKRTPTDDGEADETADSLTSNEIDKKSKFAARLAKFAKPRDNETDQ